MRQFLTPLKAFQIVVVTVALVLAGLFVYDRMQSARALSYMRDVPQTSIIGPPDAPLTVIEFIDYNCPYCPGAHATLVETMEKHGGFNIAVRQLPLLSPESVDIARMVAAAGEQGEYLRLHRALLRHKGRLRVEEAADIAARTGLDREQLMRDADGEAAHRRIYETYINAQQLGITSVPFYIIGGTFFSPDTAMPQVKDFRRLVNAELGRDAQ